LATVRIKILIKLRFLTVLRRKVFARVEEDRNYVIVVDCEVDYIILQFLAFFLVKTLQNLSRILTLYALRNQRHFNSPEIYFTSSH